MKIGMSDEVSLERLVDGYGPGRHIFMYLIEANCKHPLETSSVLHLAFEPPEAYILQCMTM